MGGFPAKATAVMAFANGRHLFSACQAHRSSITRIALLDPDETSAGFMGSKNPTLIQKILLRSEGADPDRRYSAFAVVLCGKSFVHADDAAADGPTNDNSCHMGRTKCIAHGFEGNQSHRRTYVVSCGPCNARPILSVSVAYTTLSGRRFCHSRLKMNNTVTANVARRESYTDGKVSRASIVWCSSSMTSPESKPGKPWTFLRAVVRDSEVGIDQNDRLCNLGFSSDSAVIILNSC
jgi:hypothetical protein